MGRNSSRELVGNIASALTNEPKSIAEISREIDADRQSITKYLEALTNHKYIEEVNLSNNRARKFRIRGKSIDPAEHISKGGSE